ncbi:NAD-dependent epimerase/dehydratase family protein [Modestobacter sp. VKM Ac-2986]|uniref:NAD-dependent epimerase/dehydratase family protein n=1 Tax=Modestobacter sp. VKM Ac-2986 TaxID=3004140 RepID=UPI0022ABC292|nr:NAD-dependent epimerase/dehydratase family protein [Modestobacter sp. VKM Ac-2986]MCZ2830667.1 NAD-dependent epimerase/dehydratase family protein [Modestobacter sp. VKM Ac-2986]
MKIFMTGATGYIGSVITEKLIAAGHEVTGLARSEATAENLRARGIEPVPGDLTDTQTLTDAARRADGVIQNAFDFAADFPAASAGEAHAVDALIAGLRGSGKPLVFTSGTGGLGDTGQVVFDEDTPAPETDSPVLRALQVRFDTEKAVTTASDVRGTVLRPPNVYGRDGGRTVLWAIGAAGRGLGAVPYAVGSEDNLWSLVHVDDLADLFVLAIEKSPGGELFHASAQTGIRTGDLAAAISSHAGLGGKTVALDATALADALHSAPLAQYWSINSQISGEKARRLLGWDPEHLDVLSEWGQPGS